MYVYVWQLAFSDNTVFFEHLPVLIHWICSSSSLYLLVFHHYVHHSISISPKHYLCIQVNSQSSAVTTLLWTFPVHILCMMCVGIEGIYISRWHIFNFTRNCQMDPQSIWKFPYILTETWCHQTFHFSQFWGKSRLMLTEFAFPGTSWVWAPHLGLSAIWVFLLWNAFLKISYVRASLVAQWLRIHLPMQGTRVEPWSGKIPHAAEQLSPCATTTEPAL